MSKKRKTAKTAYNNGATPLIMAYIGEDEPERGDSRGATGLARHVARIMKGNYIYVDKAMLERNTPNLHTTKGQLRRLLRQRGIPDIAIGTYAGEVKTLASAGAVHIIDDVNESIEHSRSQPYGGELVSHHLTPELLAFERAKFRAHYPQIKGQLIALMIGSDLDESRAQTLTHRLMQTLASYPHVSFFLCPSRRASGGDKQILRQIDSSQKKIDEALANPKAHKFFDSMALRDLFDRLVKKQKSPLPVKDRMTVLHVDYKKAIAGYNPYLGLLAAADHIVLTSNGSHSLLSEALFSGKNVYTYMNWRELPKLKRAGYITDLAEIDTLKPLPTRPKTPLDETAGFAGKIVRDYRAAMRADKARIEPPRLI